MRSEPSMETVDTQRGSTGPGGTPGGSTGRRRPQRLRRTGAVDDRWAAGVAGAAVMLGLLLGFGCGGPVHVRQVETLTPVPADTSRRALVELPEAASLPAEPVTVSLADLSRESLQTLRSVRLEQVAARSPVAVMGASQVLYQRTGDADFAAAAAELAFLVAQESKADLTQVAGWCLTAAARAWDFLVPGDEGVAAGRAFDPRFQTLHDIYHRSVAAYLALFPSLQGGFVDHDHAAAWESFRVSLDTGLGLRSPDLYDRLVPVESLEVQGLRNHYQRHGLGVPLVGVRENRQEVPMDRFYPPEGVVRPLTAVLVFEPVDDRSLVPHPERRVALRLYDPFRVSHLEVAGQRVPLAADFTTPWAYLAEQAELTAGMIRAEKAWDHLGLFMIEPYDPEKIPLIMVHGLRSTPLAWLELTNDVMGDPWLRQHYQVWHFTYPTSLPYLYTGHLLRDILQEIQTTVDPEDYHPALDDMVVVGHSMGGLVAKTLITEPERRLWDAMMAVPPERLAGSAADVERLQRILLYEPVPAVRRVIFIATPHGGSGMAASFLGRLGAALVRLPQEFSSFFDRLVEANPEAVNAQLERALRKPSSIRGLSPAHPMLQQLATVPIAPGVVYHSIIGDRGEPGETPSSDGVVPYESASIPGAASEQVISNAAHDVYQHPAAIAEIRRILRLHLEERRPPAEGTARRRAGSR